MATDTGAPTTTPPPTADVPFLGGEAYSIADISAYPGVIAATTYLSKPLQDTIAAIPNVHRWLDAIGMRPAVKRGMTVPTP